MNWMLLSLLICGTYFLVSPSWFITLALSVITIRVIKLFDIPSKPDVFHAPQSASASKHSIVNILERCRILGEIYYPPFVWGRNGYLQTAAYALLGHSSLKRSYDERRVIKLCDGSSVLFDLFQPICAHSSGRDIILVLCPGIANTSESNYIRTCVHYAQERGYRCAVLNHLGALPNVRLTSSRIFSYGGYEELTAMMDELFNLYPSAHFISIGFSMGANITTRYIATLRSDKLERIVVGLSVGQGYCAPSASQVYRDWFNGRRLLSYLITEKMKRLLRRNYDTAVLPFVKLGIVDDQQIWSATSVHTLDEFYTRRVNGFSCTEDFYMSCSSLPLIPDLKIPMVFLNASDDPLVPDKLWIPVMEEAAINKNIAFILLKHGGHLGFLEGSFLFPTCVTWIDRFIVEFADSAVLSQFESI